MGCQWAKRPTSENGDSEQTEQQIELVRVYREHLVLVVSGQRELSILLLLAGWLEKGGMRANAPLWSHRRLIKLKAAASHILALLVSPSANERNSFGAVCRPDTSGAN